jgi:hypothetical protein
VIQAALLLVALTGSSKGATPAEPTTAAAAAPQVLAQAEVPTASITVNDTRPVIKITGTQGAPGATVTIEASLEGGKGVLTATATDIFYDPKLLRVVADGKGQPDCEIDASIAKGSGVDKQVMARERTVGDGTALRVALLGVDNANSIPDGKLFRCRFRIAADATAGSSIGLNAQTSASDAKAQAAPVRGSQNAIVVN